MRSTRKWVYSICNSRNNVFSGFCAMGFLWGQPWEKRLDDDFWVSDWICKSYCRVDKALFFVGRVFSYLLKGDSTLQSPRKLLLDWMLYSLQDRYRFPCIFSSRMEKFFLNWSMSFFIRKPNAFASCALKLFYLGLSLICHSLKVLDSLKGFSPFSHCKNWNKIL